MAMWPTVLISSLLTVGFLSLDTQAANVALFKPTKANATCGSPAETYYSVVERSKPLRLRKLSVCDCCNASNPGVSHNASNMVDGNFATWWQSPASVDKTSITIDLRGNYQKFYYVNQLVIRFGEYYRPGQLAFYKSSDYGQSYEPWHYFVSNVDDCQEKFGVTYKTKPTTVNDVLCMEYTSEAVDKNDVVSLLLVGPRGDVNNPSNDLLVCRNVLLMLYATTQSSPPS
ncbi:netrin-4-like [Porites lutea]|uniref:netrin-4-like n=1 Tax=Porites lutea TaxID=51062 RepID=UPI003CC5462F